MSADTWRKLLFGSAVYLAVFGLAELGFRALHSGQPTQLLLEQDLGGETWLSVNEHYVEQFSMVAPESVPDPMPTLFKKHKAPDEYRIYVIGESTSRGFPHSRTEAFPFRLQQFLDAAQQDRRVKVYNFSIDATNSHIGVRVAQELAKYPPDLAIIYYGHNEFIGIGGSGRFNSPIFQLNVLLSPLRSYQWLRSVMIQSRGDDDRSILSRLASKPGVPYGGSVFESTLADFRNNYRKMLGAFKAAGVPTIACGVVSNVRDLPPLYAKGKPSAEAVRKVEELAAQGTSRELEQALGQDATLHFRAGQALLKAGKKQQARALLRRARDLDLLRFRAASEVNPIIQEECEKSSCRYLDFAEVFSSNSPDGIVGNSLMLEHVHPTLRGHAIMAAELTRLILETELKKPVPEPLKEPPPLASLADRFKATYTMLNVFENFPYAGSGYFNPLATEYIYVDMTSPKSEKKLHPQLEPELHQFLLRVSAEAPGGTVESSLLHTKLAFWYLARERVGEAYRELMIAVAQHPRNCAARSDLAYFEYKLRRNAERALELLIQANQRCPEYSSAFLNHWVLLERAGKHAQAKVLEEKLLALGVQPKPGQKFELDDPKLN